LSKKELPSLKNTPEYIKKFVKFLRDATWEKTLSQPIDNFKKAKSYTRTEIDNLLMSITKSVETTLKGAIKKLQAKPLPKKACGVELLNYALGCGLIKSKEDPLYSLAYYILKEPRNTSHHEFAIYPYNALVRFSLEANEAIEQIESRIRGRYAGTGIFSFNEKEKVIQVKKVKVQRPNGTQLPSNKKVEARFKLSNGSFKNLLLKPNGNGLFEGTYDARGLPAGTLWWDLIGIDEGGEHFTTSSANTAVLYPSIGTKCPKCGKLLNLPLIDYGRVVCDKCGHPLEI
jgi:hypothetical protein